MRQGAASAARVGGRATPSGLVDAEVVHRHVISRIVSTAFARCLALHRDLARDRERGVGAVLQQRLDRLQIITTCTLRIGRLCGDRDHVLDGC